MRQEIRPPRFAARGVEGFVPIAGELRCLQVFAQFYPGSSRKELRRSLADLLTTCGEVRDRDIAIEMVRKAGITARSPLVRRLDAERGAAGRDLQLELQRWKPRGFTRRWRNRLEL